jgi:hypothetical protein
MQLCNRDIKINPFRKQFKNNQISEKEFENEILRADKVCLYCLDPVCLIKKED